MKTLAGKLLERLSSTKIRKDKINEVRAKFPITRKELEEIRDSIVSRREEGVAFNKEEKNFLKTLGINPSNYNDVTGEASYAKFSPDDFGLSNSQLNTLLGKAAKIYGISTDELISRFGGGDAGAAFSKVCSEFLKDTAKNSYRKSVSSSFDSYMMSDIKKKLKKMDALGADELEFRAEVDDDDFVDFKDDPKQYYEPYRHHHPKGYYNRNK